MRSCHWRFGFQAQSGDSEAEEFCRCICVWLFERAWTCVLACVELKGFYMPFATDNAALESRRGSAYMKRVVKKESLATDPGSWDERIGDP
jgi:hypothetical protein